MTGFSTLYVAPITALNLQAHHFLFLSTCAELLHIYNVKHGVLCLCSAITDTLYTLLNLANIRPYYCITQDFLTTLIHRLSNDKALWYWEHNPVKYMQPMKLHDFNINYFLSSLKVI